MWKKKESRRAKYAGEYNMAKLFKGMSQTNFLDSLVEMTGKNGQELYDYLKEIVESHKEPEKKIEKVPQYNGTPSFRGTRKEFYGFLELLGGERYTKNGKDEWSACTVDALANYAARLLKVQYFDFYWVMPNGQVYRACGEIS